MSQKTVHIDGVGDIKLYKRRGSRSIRLSVNSSGEIRVTLPSWVAFKVGETYAHEHLDWIKTHLQTRKTKYSPDQKIGYSYILKFLPSNNATTRVKLHNSHIYVAMAKGLSHADTKVQAAAERGVRKALVEESDYLIGRIEELAKKHGFSYTSANCKFLKSKWGSCDSKRNILLNYYLLNLDDEQIDYVILHELTHTKNMNHSAQFWSDLENVYPNAKAVAKKVRRINP